MHGAAGTEDGLLPVAAQQLAASALARGAAVPPRDLRPLEFQDPADPDGPDVDDQHLRAGPRHARPIAEIDRLVNKRLQLEPRYQRRRQQHAGIRDDPVIIENGLEPAKLASASKRTSESWP